ncbi:MAG TPA: flagellar hook capping FlgD N-terminal domain-containing protein [Caulobacteraceae bacterium]|nr:flagellar hook capping FlgD N-terminal domain-containing protein [Caulobacteraceae bacterium]
MTAVAPTNSNSTAAAASNGLAQIADNYQTFLSLLTTQLQNQDPLSPLDTNAFTQQLTQMTGVEQQLLSNQLLQQLVNQNQGGGMVGAVDLIGKTVTASTAQATLQSGSASWSFSPSTAPATMTGSISDASGNVVWTGPITPQGAGPQTFTWNGQNQSGVQQSDGGTYTLKVTAADSGGNAIPVSTTIQGHATAVQQVNGQTMVTVGTAQVPLSAIDGVTG